MDMERCKLTGDFMVMMEFADMKVMKFYMPMTELSDYIKNKMTENMKEEFSDHTITPIKIDINTNDMSIEMYTVFAKK